LQGKRAICYPGFEEQLTGAKIVNEGVVRDGNIITGRAMGSAHDFGLEIIEALYGKEMRQKLKDAVLY
jgi:4-methyl-5(b-hydroxyethyl)-thiazole monophosphate biosynthesis